MMGRSSKSDFFHQIQSYREHYQNPYRFCDEKQIQALKESCAYLSTLSLGSDGLNIQTTHQGVGVESHHLYICRVDHRACGESTTGLLKSAPDSYEYFFGHSQGFISRVCGSLLAIWMEKSHITPPTAHQIALLGNHVNRLNDVTDEIITQMIRYGSHVAGEQLWSFIQRSHEYPVRRSGYVLNVLALLGCLRAVSDAEEDRLTDF